MSLRRMTNQLHATTTSLVPHQIAYVLRNKNADKFLLTLKILKKSNPVGLHH